MTKHKKYKCIGTKGSGMTTVLALMVLTKQIEKEHGDVDG